MPRLTNATPKYRKHRASGQAVVTLNGKDHYLCRNSQLLAHDSQSFTILSPGYPAFLPSSGAFDRLSSRWTSRVGPAKRLGKRTIEVVDKLQQSFFQGGQ